MKSVVAVVCCLLLAINSIAGLTLYVKPNNSGGHEECPRDQVCKYLSSYVHYNFSKDTTFLFLRGTHWLSSELQVSDVNEISFKGLSNDSMAVTIECTKIEKSGFRFNNVTKISIRLITIQFCGAQDVRGNAENVATYSALNFNQVNDIDLTDVIVANSSGYGVFIKSYLGHIKIQRSQFDYNRGNSDYAGGNARFLFVSNSLGEDTEEIILEIEKSNFTNGKANDNSTVSHIAGGIHVESVYSSLYMSLNTVRIENNLGGNVKLEATSMRGKAVQVYIIASLIDQGKARKGAGLSFYALPSDISTNYQHCIQMTENKLTIVDTNFTRNIAEHSAGGMLLDLHDSLCISNKVELSNCVFAANTIRTKQLMHSTGAGMLVIRHKFPGFYNHFLPIQNELSLTNTKFIGNLAFPQASIVVLLSIEAVELKECTFANNTGTALSLRSSIVVFSGSIIFEDNSAANGGAIKLCEASSFFINNHTTVLFQNNSVIETGGAIFGQKICVDKHTYCFFQPNVNTTTNVENLITENEMQLVFINNTAKIAGDDIYGGDIDNCYTYWSFYNGSSNKLSSYLSHEIFNNIASINPVTNTSISSDPYMIIFCNSTSTDQNDQNRTVIPGGTFSVSLQALGQRNGLTRAMIEIVVNSSQVIISSSRLFSQMHTCEDIAITLESNSINITIQLVFQLQSYYNSMPIEDEKQAHLNIFIKKCPWGFEFYDGICHCSKLIKLTSCSCRLKDLTIHCLYPWHWIGCKIDSNESSCTGKELRTFSACAYEYCNQATVNFTADTVDEQCVAGRTGIACGSCKQNYSVVLGTSMCRICSNSYLWLVVVYLSTGVFLIVLLTSLDITVTNGTLNGLLFYANVVHASKYSFFPNFYEKDVLRIMIAWLNLDLGIEVCFYNGMDVYQKTWLQFGYIFYIWSLQTFIVFLCRKYIFFTRLCGRNVTKVMATLVLMCFMKAVLTVQGTLLFIHLRSSDNETMLVWVSDASIKLHSGKLMPLLVVASLLGFLLFSFTLCLLSIQILNKLSYRRGIRWVSRLQPFFEAFTGPCNHNYAFWPGFLFFMRVTLVILSSFHDSLSYTRIRTLTTCAVAVLIIVLSFLYPSGVYKKWSLNILELSFMLNLAALSALLNITPIARKPKRIQLCTTTSIVIALIIFCSYNVKMHYKRIKKLGVTCMKGVLQMLSHVNRRSPEECSPHHDNRRVTRSEVSLASASVEDESSPLLHVNNLPPAKLPVQLREPLLEDN